MRRYTISFVDGEQRLGAVSFDSRPKAQGALDMFWCLIAAYPFMNVKLVLHIEEDK